MFTIANLLAFTLLECIYTSIIQICSLPPSLSLFSLFIYIFGELPNVELKENREDRSEKVTNEEVLVRVGENKTFLSNMLDSKANWIGHILRRNCLLHGALKDG